MKADKLMLKLTSLDVETKTIYPDLSLTELLSWLQNSTQHINAFALHYEVANNLIKFEIKEIADLKEEIKELEDKAREIVEIYILTTPTDKESGATMVVSKLAHPIIEMNELLNKH